jgi:diguanylate cyclase (GGDEF)-like protein/putative nucleotidyltransferase with HDIG domain
MGNCLNQLPTTLWLPTLASFLLLVFVIQRLMHHRGEQRRSEAQLLHFTDLHLLTTTLSSAPDLKQTVDQTLEGILQALDLTQGFAILHLPGSDELNYTTARGFSAQAVERLATSPLRDYLATSGERWGTLMVFPDLLRTDLITAWQRDPLFGEFRALFASEGPRTLLVVGLQTRERSYGALVVGSRQVTTFQPGELRLTLSIGNQISVALENRSLQKAAERQDEELRILHRVGEALSATFDLEMQHEILQRELKGLIGAGNFSLVFQESPDGRPETAYGLNQGSPETARNPASADGPSEYVLRTRTPLLIANDFLGATRRLGISQIDPRIMAWAGVPIHFSDGSMGVLAVADFEREGTLNERRFELLKILAGEVAVAIENARLFQQEQRRARHLALLNELARKASAVLDPKELLSGICQQLRSTFGFDLTRVETLDKELDELVVQAQEGYAPALLGRRAKLGEGLSGFAAESGEPILANDVARDDRYIPFHAGVRSSLAMPLKYRSEILGVLSIENLRSNSFSQQDVLTLRTLADQLAIALKNAQAYQVAQEQAITDSLTGLKTHRYFMEALDVEWRRSPRSGQHFSLIMMDLDDFKLVNDRHGHLEGDRVLAAVGRVLDARSRQSNVVAHYGGDQFAVLMPQASPEQAEILAERLRYGLSADPYLASRAITASFGIATFPVHGATPEEIVRVAESGMYLAKHERGNSVRVASGSSESPTTDWKHQLLEAYLGVAVKRMFSTGPEVFNQYLARFEAATRDTNGENPSLMDTVTALAFTIDAKDHYTQGHSQSVSRLAAQLAQQLGLSSEEMEDIRLAGILHDIGKIGVPESVLNKPSCLTPEEYELIKSHAILGEKILEPLKVKAIERIRKMVRSHHERVDGKGYPDGLTGEDIPLGARIITIADCFDTLVSERSYKHACLLEEAVEELQKGKGTQFDSTLLDAFLTSLAAHGAPRRGAAAWSEAN